MLSSVYIGKTDAPLIRELIDIHWHSRVSYNPVIVDCTYGSGAFWGWPLPDAERILGCDMDPVRSKHIRSNYLALPFKSNTIEILCWDPPHIPDSGSPRPKFMDNLYSIVWHTESLKEQCKIFCKEAKRVLRANGLIICKISDQIQSGKRHWQHYDFMTACFETGLTVCDLVIKTRVSATPQPRDYQLHAHNAHSYFIVARKGTC